MEEHEGVLSSRSALKLLAEEARGIGEYDSLETASLALAEACGSDAPSDAFFALCSYQSSRARKWMVGALRRAIGKNNKLSLFLREQARMEQAAVKSPQAHERV